MATECMFRLLGKKIIAFLRSKILLNWTYDSVCKFQPKTPTLKQEEMSSLKFTD